MFGLDNDTIAKINSVFEKYTEVEEVTIYGSRAKGNYKEGSDIDISLKGNYLTKEIQSNIYTDIENLNTPYLFDISIFNQLHSPELLEHIKRVGQIFYKK